MSDFTPDEQRLADAFAEERAPQGANAWHGREARRFRAGNPWLRPAAAVLAVAVVAGGLGSYFGLRAHFAGNGTASSGTYPSARSDAAMAYDQADGRVVMFGGFDKTGRPLGDTWTWDGSGWTQLHPPAAPSARSGAAMAYDPVTHDVLLFGGTTVNQFSPVPQIAVCAPQPQPITGTALPEPAFASPKPAGSLPAPQPNQTLPPIPPAATGVVGSTAVPAPTAIAVPPATCWPSVPTNKGDTWAWDGTTWRHAASGPDFWPGWTWMATDPVSGRPLLVSDSPYISAALKCATPCTIEPRAYSWNGAGWQSVHAAFPASAAQLSSGSQVLGLVIDPASGHLALVNQAAPILVCGGFSSGSGAAASGVPPVGAPPDRCLGQGGTAAAVAAYITTWTGTGWGGVAKLSGGPGAPVEGSLFSDDARHTVVFAGRPTNLDVGAEAGQTNSTWVWNGSRWTLRTGSVPDAIVGAASAFDADSGQVVLFGGLGLKTDTSGADNLPVLNATWTWDGSRWTLRGGQRVASRTPPVPSPPSGTICAVPPAPSLGSSTPALGRLQPICPPPPGGSGQPFLK